MIKKLLDIILGGGTRFQMTIIYAAIYMILSFAHCLNAIAFGTFSGVFGAWIASQHYRPHKEDIDNDDNPNPDNLPSKDEDVNIPLK